jgi:hypothetical protein
MKELGTAFQNLMPERRYLLSDLIAGLTFAVVNVPQAMGHALLATVNPVLGDPMTGRQISPLTAAALCVKPRGQMTGRQIVNVDALKAASVEFTTMRQLAMRFRGLLRGGTVERLDIWLSDARTCGIYGMRRFVRTLRQDIEAVRNAVLEPWSNGQTEGQINRLKTLKRAMYGRAGVDLLRARMMPMRS